MTTASPLYIGIEIGGTKLQVVAGDHEGNIIDRVRCAVNAEQGAVHIQQQIEQGVQQLQQQHKIAAIGVGFGGPVDWQTGAIQLSHQVGGWENVNLIHWLHQITGLPVAVDNDANTAALGEAINGSGKGYKNVFYITIGSGIGGGLVINQRVYHGRIPGEVEIGHVRLNKKGETVEQCCSGWAVNKMVSAYIAQHPNSKLAELAGNNDVPGAYLLRPAIEANDTDALDLLATVADDLAFALSHIVHLFNPDVIILGGGLSLMGDILTAPLTERLPHYIMQALLPIPPVLIAGLKEDAVPAGALHLAQRSIVGSR